MVFKGLEKTNATFSIDITTDNSSSPISNTVGEFTWIQGKLDSTDIWRYNDGTEMQYFNWNTQSNQPHRRVGEITLVTREPYGYRWHDAFPAQIFPAMCQRK
jgi:hypothetical protein